MSPPADITADATQRSGPSLLLPFTIGHFANDWAPTAVWLIVPAMAVTMNLSPAEVGLLFTIHSTGSALAFLPAGVLADRVANRGRLLQITFWWVAVGYALAAFAPGYWSFALLLALAGAGDAMWHPIATGVLVQQAPENRAQALGIHAIGGSLAAVLAPLSVGFLLLFMDWRHALLITVIPAAIMGLVFLRIAKHVPPAAQSALSPVDAIALWRAWMRPAGLALIVMISAYSMAMIALLAMTPLFLQTVHGLSPLVTGMAFSLMLLFGALLQPLIGKFSDQIGRRPVVVTGNLIAMVAAVAIALASGPGFAIAAMVVGGLFRQARSDHPGIHLRRHGRSWGAGRSRRRCAGQRRSALRVHPGGVSLCLHRGHGFRGAIYQGAGIMARSEPKTLERIAVIGASWAACFLSRGPAVRVRQQQELDAPI
jgi:FSR family fosmidomycin resistance protein-like MFS transporter